MKQPNIGMTLYQTYDERHQQPQVMAFLVVEADNSGVFSTVSVEKWEQDSRYGHLPMQSLALLLISVLAVLPECN